MSRAQEMHRNREIACTVPTQPKTAHLPFDKSVISKNQLTRSGWQAVVCGMCLLGGDGEDAGWAGDSVGDGGAEDDLEVSG
jgi:hypothetical protein